MFLIFVMQHYLFIYSIICLFIYLIWADKCMYAISQHFKSEYACTVYTVYIHILHMYMDNVMHKFYLHVFIQHCFRSYYFL